MAIATSRWFILATLVMLALGNLDAVGQSTGEGPVALDSRLESEPVSLGALGLTIHPPSGATTVVERFHAGTTLLMSDGRSNPRWRVRFESLSVPLEGKPAAELVEDYLGSLRRQGAVFDPISNAPFAADGGRTWDETGRPGHLLFIETATPKGQPFVDGRLIVPAGDLNFLIGTILIVPRHFDEIRDDLAASFATIRVRTHEERQAEIAREVANGGSLLLTLTESDLRQLAGKEVCSRIIDQRTGEDVGFTILRSSEGMRGRTTPRRLEHEYTEAGREIGLLVQSQFLLREDHPRTPIHHDTYAAHWLAWDRRIGEWSMLQTRIQGENRNAQAITGVLTSSEVDASASELTVVWTDPGGKGQPNRWRIPDVFMPQTIASCLVWLFPGEVDQPITYRSYVYSRAETDPGIVMREDTWGPRSGGEPGWELTTRIGTAGVATTSIYDASRNLIERRLPNGLVARASTLDELRSIWGDGLGRRFDRPMPGLEDGPDPEVTSGRRSTRPRVGR